MEKTNNPLNLITFGKSVTRPEALETMPAAKLMAMLQNGRWRKPIEAIRGEKNPTLQKEMKLRLPYFVYGVLEGPRSEENVRQVNGIVFDFDRVGDFTAAKQKLMDAAPWFRWLFRSPVDGLKLMVPFSRPVTDKAEYTRIWKLLKAEIEAKSGLKADNTPDLCRACFLSWDDDVITCPEEWQKDLDEYLREAEMIGVSDGDAGVERGNNTSCSPCSQRSLDSRAGWTPGYTDLDEVQAKSAVEYLALRKIDRRDWIRCGIALYNHFGEDGIVYWLQFAYNPNYDDTPEDLRKVWQRLKKYPGVGLGTLFYVAEQYGWINAIQVPAAGKEVAALAEAPDKEGMGGAAALTGGAATASTERPSPPAHT
ncbi:MAG TPA: BT4734/BF3469 family protein, partial [Candidatus Syntrophosphaera sp.]|nr:BT4734/BF3469 family protein [Candidatus Syntrophosphaera sp.]